MKKLEGKTAIITGAGSGFGRAIAKLYAKEGAKIIIADINDEGGKETSKEIHEMSGEAQYIKADISKSSDYSNLIQETVNSYGKLDILVNNAGIGMSATPIEEVSEEFWDKVININLKSIYLGSYYAIPIMKKAGSGVIINIASAAGISPRPGLTPYNTSKGGAILLTKSLAIELASSKIRVNSISPVVSDTPMLKTFIGDKMSYEKGKETFEASVPLGRFCKPEDVAFAALYLASNDASLVTGVNLEVDGGRTI